MQKFDVQLALDAVKDARSQWGSAHRAFQTKVDKVLDRLIHEAAVNYMSASEFAKFSGLTLKQVRDLMRRNKMAVSSGKQLLAKHAAEALATNSDLLGIPVHEMDLMSPLAYLPAGESLTRALTEAKVARVTELPEYGDAEALADKLQDAGPMPDEAVAWVNEVIARGVLIPVSGNSQ